MLSLGQTTENVAKMGALYLYTIEFGAYKEKNQTKCYGAGFGGCIDEINNFIDCTANHRKLDPKNDLPLDYPIIFKQKTFFVADSLKDATDTILDFSKTLEKPFFSWYDFNKNEVMTNKEVKRLPLFHDVE